MTVNVTRLGAMNLPFRMPPSSTTSRLSRSTHTRALVLSTLMAAAACGDQTGQRFQVRLEGGPQGESAIVAADTSSEALRPLRFVYASVLSPERSVLTYARLGRYLSAKLGREVAIVRRRTYAELNELLRTGQAEAGLVCTGAFAAGEDGFGLQAVAIPVIEGKRTYQSFVIVRRDSGLSTFSSLAGSVFAFTDPLSNTGYRYVAARLHDQGFTPRAYFGDVVFTYGHDNSIDAVRDGIVDAGSIDSLVWDELVRRDPSLAEDVIIIDRSEDFPINPVAVAPGQPDALRSAIAAVFLSMEEDEEGRRILLELGTEEFVAPTAELLEGYNAIARSWRRLGTSTAGSDAGTVD